MKSFRKYGVSPYSVAVIHGGPGAAGEMRPVAVEIGKYCGVLEPFQTKSTINGQADELYRLLKRQADLPVILIGYSWGAWLSVIFAAAHPGMVRKLILVSSGPFEEKYARDIMKTRMARLTEDDRKEVNNIMKSLGKNGKADNRLMGRLGELFSIADSKRKTRYEQETTQCRYDIYTSVWKEAVELRNSGKLLELTREASCPVIAIHGDYDAHPAEGVELSLRGILKDFRFILLPQCGHQPWMEKEAGDKFYKILEEEIT